MTLERVVRCLQIAKECPPNTNMRPITLSGPPGSVEMAKGMVLSKVDVRC